MIADRNDSVQIFPVQTFCRRLNALHTFPVEPFEPFFKDQDKGDHFRLSEGLLCSIK